MSPLKWSKININIHNQYDNAFKLIFMIYYTLDRDLIHLEEIVLSLFSPTV
jgi:hypothetical protein